MSLIRVGVLRGGPSDEYEVSLKSGATVLSSLSHEKLADKYHVRDILISKDGTWHSAGVPVDINQVLSQVDVLVNALHGRYGEDGKLQAALDLHRVPYTGTRALGSAIGMNKILSKNIFKQHGIKIPMHTVINAESLLDGSLDREIDKTFRSMPLPVVVKPAESGSSIGISIARAFEEIKPAIHKAFSFSRRHDETLAPVLIEEYISGIEATVGVVDRLRDQDIYTLPPIEIRHNHRGAQVSAEAIVPANFSPEVKAELERMARDIHKALDLRHYSASDFIVTPRRGIFALEVNTLPGMTSTSLIPKALASVGVELHDFLDHIIGLALEGK